MSVSTIESVIAQLQAQGAVAGIHEDDIIAAIIALQAVGSMRRQYDPIPYGQAISGASWQVVECFDDALPNSGRGMTANLGTHRLTVESGGAGRWSADYSVYFVTDNDVEFALRRNGSGVALETGQGSGRGTVSAQWPVPVALSTNDYIELVARTNPGQTANIGVYNAHMWFRREIPST